VYKARVNKIAQVLKNAGLSNQKAKNLKLVLRKIKDDWDTLSLSKLKDFNDKELENYLLTLPGIGLKSARCIMMYSFGRKAFPVDSHCFRIIKRLGWIISKSKYTEKVQDSVQKMIPKELRYRLHVNLIQHGRKVCLPYIPHCKECCINVNCNQRLTHLIA